MYFVNVPFAAILCPSVTHLGKFCPVSVQAWTLLAQTSSFSWLLTVCCISPDYFGLSELFPVVLQCSTSHALSVQ